MIKWLKSTWKAVKTAANQPMTEHSMEFQRAIAGVPVCPCCSKRHIKNSVQGTGPK